MSEPADMRELEQVLGAVADCKNGEDLLKQLKYLRNICARGNKYQEMIITHQSLHGLLRNVVLQNNADMPVDSRIQTMGWQLLANSIVNNGPAQKILWSLYGDDILKCCSLAPLGVNTNIMLMIMFNIFFFKSPEQGVGLTDKQVLQAIINVWQAILQEKSEANLEYLHFFYEYFLLSNGRIAVRRYAELTPDERIIFLDYIANYISTDSPNGLVDDFLLKYMSKEFKIKSDCILRQSDQQGMQQLHPREAYALLRVIAGASGSDSYAGIFATDHSLFLNVSSLLRCLVAAGKEAQKNIFTPMSKLEEVAVSSNISHEFESEISYELKTLLIRCVANLLYKNKTNQGYCLDTQLMPTLFECTNMDARNPLIKEWSIVAIRNACCGCPEIQDLIRDMTKKGDAPNELLSELNLQMGALRIQSNK